MCAALAPVRAAAADAMIASLLRCVTVAKGGGSAAVFGSTAAGLAGRCALRLALLQLLHHVTTGAQAQRH